MGGGTRSYEMAKRLVQNGHEVHIITSWREQSDEKSWFSSEVEGIQIHWLPVPYSNSLSFNQRIKAFLNYAFKAGRKAREIGGDIVFATSTPLTISIPAVSTAKKLKVPMVFEVRDLWPELPIAIGAIKNPILKFLTKRLELFSYKNAAQIIALSPGMAEGVLKTGYPKEKVTIIPNSADLNLFKPDALKAEQFRSKYPELKNYPIVLYAGTLGIINGVSYLAELAAEVSKTTPDIKFVVFGHGAEWDIVQNKAKQLGILNVSFYMYSSIPKTELVSAFCAADISTSLFVDLKPMEANSANKFFDTLSSGTPVAINYGGWHSTLLEKHSAGIQLSRNINEAALEIVEFLKKPDLQKEIGGNARRLAETDFSRDLLATKLESVLIDATSL